MAGIEDGVAAEPEGCLVEKVIAEAQLCEERADDDNAESDADHQPREDAQEALAEKRGRTWIAEIAACDEEATDDKEGGDGDFSEATVATEAEIRLGVGGAIAKS